MGWARGNGIDKTCFYLMFLPVRTEGFFSIYWKKVYHSGWIMSVKLCFHESFIRSIQTSVSFEPSAGASGQRRFACVSQELRCISHLPSFSQLHHELRSPHLPSRERNGKNLRVQMKLTKRTFGLCVNNANCFAVIYRGETWCESSRIALSLYMKVIFICRVGRFFLVRSSLVTRD